MTAAIIGRKEECATLQRLLVSKQPELLAIYGRRRVGKTYLVRNYYSRNLTFYCTGQAGGTLRQQLNNFREQLTLHFKDQSFQTPINWQEAFSLLRAALDSKKGHEKKVLFFDELPWFDTHKSGFLSAFDYFWNAYVTQRNDLLVVICGSAASWIIRKVVNNKRGLHNRITQRIRLLPFTLQETELYLQARNIHLSRYQLLQLYMTIGGVPHYLNAVKRGKSIQQNIAEICFSKDGVLSGEFSNLYRALFSSPEKHEEIIRALAAKNMGLTRSELLDDAKLLTGGGLTMVLTELEESGFIERIQPYGRKTKDALYRLTDEFSFFYFRFMEGGASRGKDQWLAQSQSPRYRAWSGYAFENVCLKHINQLRQALGISGMHTSQASWRSTGSDQQQGAQIDLLIDRPDQCINICEMKFSEHMFTIDKSYAVLLQKKRMAFHMSTQTRKTIFLTMITTYGTVNNDHKQQQVDNELTMDHLFD